MKELEMYIGATYIYICHPSVMNKKLETFPNPEMPTILTNTGVESPKTDVKTTYLENKKIDESIRQKLKNKDVYETYTNNIYNIIVGQSNKQLK